MADRIDAPLATYATASATAVAALLHERYGLSTASSCALLNRGSDDTYAIVTPRRERFVLRLSGHRARGPADVEAETAFLAHLASADVPVAAAVPTRDGALFTSAALPDGPRPAVLFHHADGRLPDLDGQNDARLQGMTLARVHDAVDTYPGKAAGRFRLDRDHLLHRQVAAVLALDVEAPRARRDIQALAARLGDALARVESELIPRAATATATA